MLWLGDKVYVAELPGTYWSWRDGHWKKWSPRWPKVKVVSHIVVRSFSLEKRKDLGSYRYIEKEL